jgi:hypothetical protein
MPVGRKEGAGCRIGARSRSGEGLAPREALALAVVDIVGDVVDAVFAFWKSLGAKPAVVVHVNGVEYRLDLLGRKLERWGNSSITCWNVNAPDRAEDKSGPAGRLAVGLLRPGLPCSDRKACNDRSHHQPPSLHAALRGPSPVFVASRC